MKNRISQIAMVILAVLAAGCSTDNSDNTLMDPAVNAQAVTDLAVSGTWVISSFIDDDEDETSLFDGYVFTFNADGSLIADDGVNSVVGSWSVTVDDDWDDDDYDDRDDIDFNIFFSAPIFSELTDDWDIISRSDNRIELGDDDDDDDIYDDEILVFERN